MKCALEREETKKEWLEVLTVEEGKILRAALNVSEWHGALPSVFVTSGRPPT